MYNKKSQIVSRDIKFPENRELKTKIIAGDNKIIARYSGYSAGTIREMLNGYRRLTDKATRAIIRLMKEREELKSSLDQIVNQ